MFVVNYTPQGMAYQVAHTIQAHAGAVHVARFNPGGRYILTGGGDQQIHLWNAATGAGDDVDAKGRSPCIQRYSGHSYEVMTIDIAPDSMRFASGGPDRAIMLWDVAAGQVGGDRLPAGGLGPADQRVLADTVAPPHVDPAQQQDVGVVGARGGGAHAARMPPTPPRAEDYPGPDGRPLQRRAQRGRRRRPGRHRGRPAPRRTAGRAHAPAHAG